jgi:hypothetical protein
LEAERIRPAADRKPIITRRTRKNTSRERDDASKQRIAFTNRYFGQSATGLGILSASGDLGGRVDADGLRLVLLGGDGGAGGVSGGGTNSTSSDGLGVRNNGLVDLLVSDDRGGSVLLDSLVGGGSGVLLLGLDAVQGLAGTATKVAEHGLALVGSRGASGGGGLGSLGLLNSLSGRGNDGSDLSGGLLNLDGLSGDDLVLGGDNRGGGLSLERLLLGGRRAGAALTLVHERQAGEEVLLLLAGGGGLSLCGLGSGLTDGRGGGVSGRRGHGSLNRLGGGGLGQLGSGVRDSGVLGRDLGLEVELLLLGGRLQATPGTGNAAEDAATLADLGLLLSGGLGGSNRGDGKGLDGLLLSGDGHDCEMVSVCARGAGSFLILTGSGLESRSLGGDRSGDGDDGLVVGLLELLVNGLLFLLLLLLHVVLLLLALQLVEHAAGCGAALGLLLELLVLAVGRTDALGLGGVDLGALLGQGSASLSGGNGTASDVGSVCQIGQFVLVNTSRRDEHTQLLNLGLVALAVANGLLGGLAKLDRLLDRLVPAIALSVAVGLEAVLVAGDLKGELVGRGLLEVGGVVESNDASRLGAVTLALLVEEEEALAGLAGVGGDGVRNLGLLATEVETQVLRSDGRVVEPELLLGESELPGEVLEGDFFWAISS